jgi:Mitochondrial pyruvate carriers
MVINPVNWQLFSVNVFVGAIGLYQCSRIAMYQYAQPVQK